MSHFTVGVIVDKLSDEEVHKKLAPYQENNMKDVPKDMYGEFRKEVERFIEEYLLK